MMSDGYTYEEADMQCQIDWQARQAKLIDGNAKLIDAIEAAIKRHKYAYAASHEGVPATAGKGPPQTFRESEITTWVPPPPAAPAASAATAALAAPAASKPPATEEGITARECSRADMPPHMSWAAEEGIRERHSIRVDRFPRKPPPSGRHWVFKGIRFVHPWLTLMYGHEAVEGEGAGSAAPATTTATAPPATTTPAPDFDSWIEVYEDGESVKQSP